MDESEIKEARGFAIRKMSRIGLALQSRSAKCVGATDGRSERLRACRLSLAIVEAAETASETTIATAARARRDSALLAPPSSRP
jgi:hypothetical protein